MRKPHQMPSIRSTALWTLLTVTLLVIASWGLLIAVVAIAVKVSVQIVALLGGAQ